MAAAAPPYAPLALPRRYPLITHIEGSIAFLKNTTSTPLRVDPSGLLGGLLLTFKGTNTTGATAPTPTNASPYGIFSRVTLSTGGGVGKTIDVSGYELNIAERIREADYVDDPVVGVATSTANTMTFALFIPVCVRLGDLYSQWTDLLGSIFTGDPQVTCNVTLTFADEFAIFSNQTAAAAAVAGTITVTSFKYDVPNPDRDPMLLGAISWAHQVIEERLDSSANQNPYQLPTNEPRVYLRHFLLYSEQAAAPQNAKTYKNGVITVWDLNLQDYLHFFENVQEQPILEMQLRRYVVNLPAGSYCADFGASMYRTQWLPVERVSLFKSAPTITSPGTGAAVAVCQESLVPSPLARKWITSGVAQGIQLKAA
jgi:hypothetical protein